MNTGGNEWYWNLNLHRNQPILGNLSAVSNTTLPLSAALYTSAVLTDRGICVGMRNVNLKGVNPAPSSDLHDIPNCNNGMNVVGEHNGQTWRAAYERMRYSVLTDPTMATTHIEHQNCEQFPQNLVDNYTDYTMDNSCDTAEQCPSSNTIGAEFNPFHLFGDKSKLSAFNFSNNSQRQKLAQVWNHSADFVTASNAYRTQAELLQSSIQTPYHNYHYLTDGDEWLNGAHRYGHRNIIYAKSISPRSNSPTSYAPSNALKATTAILNQRLDNSVSRLNHVVAPKKKWIRNYMQSNSHLWFIFLRLFIFGSFLCEHSSSLVFSDFFPPSIFIFLYFSVISLAICIYFCVIFLNVLFAISNVMEIALHGQRHYLFTLLCEK